MRKLVLIAMFALPLQAVTVDRIAAVVDRQVLTVSEISQMVQIRFFPRKAETEDAHRREVLDALIAQMLRFRDAERFGAQDIPRDSIEARLLEIEHRFPSRADYEQALAQSGLTVEDLSALVKRQLQVEAYIQERFGPLVLVTAEEIEAYYRGPWSQQRRQRGLPVPPLAEVREEVRTAARSSRLSDEVERWTTMLRARANVDVFAWK